MAKTAFISYASDDEAVATTICDFLERHRVSCWLAHRDVRPGADYAAEIIDAIETSAVLVLVLSENANDSAFVKREVERAVSKGKPIFPVRVREVLPSKSLELFISAAHWIDAWHPPIEQYLERLADSIRAAAALYPTVGGDRARDEPLAPESPGSAVAARSRTAATPARRARLVQLSLVAAVIVLGALLAWNVFRQPAAAPVPSDGSADLPPAVDAARPNAPVNDAPARPLPAPTVAGTELCPLRLSVNPELPTPFTCTCEAQSISAGFTIWGTDVYTDDSSLCRAALHAGVIPAGGGSITVMRTEGRALYVGSARHGVASSDYGANESSIEFKGTPRTSGPTLCPVRLSVNREMPSPVTCRCTAEATQVGSVWGTEVYTDDSSLCRAAVHAGVIRPAGGTITVVRTEGRQIYPGSTRMGVTSLDYGVYSASIRFR